MTSAAEALLLTLAKRPLKPPSDGDDALRELCAAGLAERRETKSGPRCLLTEAGVQRRDAIKKARAAEKKAATPTRKPAAARARAASNADLQALEARLIERLDAIAERLAARIEALLGSRLRLPNGGGVPPEVGSPDEAARPGSLPEVASFGSSADVADRVVRAIHALAVKHGRLVPIAELRCALADVPRPTLDHALFDLERSRRLYLKIANDPLAVRDPEEGIRISDRGLVYYAALP